MSEALHARFDTALRLTEQAAGMAMSLRPPPGAASGVLKGPQDWVTEADRAVERFLSEQLAAAFPADGFQGEEGGVARNGGLRWVVDPIDGTSNFARGGSRFCVSVACLEADTPLIGIIVAPALRETVTARRNAGAWLNGSAIHAAGTRQAELAVVEVGWSRHASNAAYLRLCERVLAAGASLRNGGSGALGLADVAIGRLDGYVELHIHLWDVAAALVVLREAGARASDFMTGDGPRGGGAIAAFAPGLAGAWPDLPGLPPLT